MSDLGVTRLEPLEIAGIDGEPLRLEELIDRRALVEMIDSFEHLFGVPIRVISTSGTTLAGTGGFAPLCAVVNEHEAGQRACAGILEEVRKREVVPISRLGGDPLPGTSTSTPPPRDDDAAPAPVSTAPISGVQDGTALPEGSRRCFTGAV